MFGANDTTISPTAADIVKRHKLPRGIYGLAIPGDERIVEHSGPTRTLTHALQAQAPSRLYRLNAGWRYVGEVTADGRFVDQRR